jgi:hypothetical protein
MGQEAITNRSSFPDFSLGLHPPWTNRNVARMGWRIEDQKNTAPYGVSGPVVGVPEQDKVVENTTSMKCEQIACMNCRLEMTTFGEMRERQENVALIAFSSSFSVDSDRGSGGVSLYAVDLKAHSVAVSATDVVVSKCLCDASPF